MKPCIIETFKPDMIKWSITNRKKLVKLTIHQ